MALVSISIASLLLNGCGNSSSGDGTLSLSDLSQLPDASGMVKANGGTRNIQFGNYSLSGGLDLAASFTKTLSRPVAPTVSSIGETYSYFWPETLISDINTNWSSSDPDQKNNYRNLFWGKDYSTPGPGGNGACQMAMSSAEALGKVLEGAGTMCYMKALPSIPSGVTISSGSAADLFKQGTADKKIRVTVTNMPTNRPSFTVNFTIKGSSTVGSDVYGYDVHFCQGSTVTNTESATVNKSTGLVTMTSDMKEGPNNYGSNTVTAHLTNDGSNIAFDLTKDRTAISYGSYSLQEYRGKVIISGDNTITNFRLNTGDGYSNKDFSRASFLGSSMTTLQFLQGAYKGLGEWSSNQFSYAGATDYQTVNSGSYQGTYYVALDPANSALAQSSDFTSVDLATNDFFAGSAPAAPSYDDTALCTNWTPDISVTMDFANSAVLAVQSECESGQDWKSINFYLCQGKKLVETSPNNYEAQNIPALTNAFTNVQSW
jgi:hypothetical protein